MNMLQSLPKSEPASGSAMAQWPEANQRANSDANSLRSEAMCVASGS